MRVGGGKAKVWAFICDEMFLDNVTDCAEYRLPLAILVKNGNRALDYA